MTDTPRVILIRERLGESIASDLWTFMTIGGLWSLGYFAGSAALEWVGVIMGLVFIIGRGASKVSGKSNFMTPDQARAWLDSEFPPDPPEAA